MITASYPIITDGKLLGVASRDVTLEQLSRSVLEHLTREDGVSALIVDQRGLAIDASDADLAAELQTVNTKAGAAVLFYRTAKGLKGLEQKDAVVSRFHWVNSVTEQVIGHGAKTGESPMVALEADGRNVLAARIPSTGWYVIIAVDEVSADS
jgi:hypothetical protein